MPRKPISFELDFMIKDIFPRFTVKQFDDVSFNIKPKNQGLDYDTTGMTGKIFVGVNNDMFMQTTGITVSNNNINILLDRNMLQKQGRAYAEVELTDSNGTITSSSFIFDIDPKIGEGGQIPGEYEGFVEKYERLISEFKSQVNSTINNCNTNVNSAIKQCNINVDNKLNTVDSLINVKISDFEKRFNRLTSSQQQDAEVIDARTDFKGVVFDSLKERIDYTDKILRESTVSTVATESDFTTVKATSNGYFEDVKLEGKTLVNLFDNLTSIGRSYTYDTLTKILKSHPSGIDDTPWPNVPSLFNISANREYTLIFTAITDNTILAIRTIDDKQDITINPCYIGLNVIKFTPSGTNFKIKMYDANRSTQVSISHLMLLEGDHTQNPPSYFEGLKSVGQNVDEIVVSSVKGDGNLFDGVVEKGNLSGGTGVEISHSNIVRTDFIPVRQKSISIKNFSNGKLSVEKYVLFDKNYNFIKASKFNTLGDITIVPTSDTKYVRFTFRDYQSANNPINLSDLKFNIQYSDSVSTQYTPHQSDKKRLLFYNTETQSWEKPILREWDSIEKHSDGKYYYHQRSGEVVLNGSESWTFENSSGFVYTTMHDMIRLNDYTDAIICDILPTTPNKSFGLVGITGYANLGQYEGQNWIYIKSDNISSAESAKQWLQANNVTVVYQLAQEKVYECTNIGLITYANETNYIVESGAIVPRSTLKVHNNISNVVSLLQKKVSLLESNITRYTITQNRLMLTSRYNADTVGFKVDVATLRNSFEYDNDLYELILNNILVGKDNYDREYIENLIIFYWMDFVISDEMHSALFEIIEEQHNPKVIEDEEAPL